MKKIFSKKYWLVFVSVLAVAGGIAWACAGGDMEYERPSNFSAAGIVDSAYRPFFYSYYFYNDIVYDTKHNDRFNEANTRDWSAWLSDRFNKTEIDYLLNQSTTGQADSAVAFAAGKIRSLPPALRSFKMLADKNQKTANFLKYLSLAKKCEQFAVVYWNYWDGSPKKKPFASAAKVKNELLAGFANTQDQFLKQRYWFQLVRFYFFNDAPQLAIELFEKNSNVFPKNVMYYRTQANAAGAYYSLKDYSKANYYYSKVYDGCNELKTVAHYSFHPQEEADWKKTLALCKDKNEQITLWQMLGIFYNDEKRSIEEIYKLNPASEKLDLLLMRAVNKAESQMAATSSYATDELPMLTSNPVDAGLLEITGRIARAANTARPYLWCIAAGYLNTMNGGHSAAKAYYDRAEKIAAKDAKTQMQFRLFNVMNKIALAKRIDTKFENDIVNDLTWLNRLDAWSSEFRFVEAFNWIRASMAYKYRTQNDLVKSECFRYSVPFYLNNANVEAMKSFIGKNNKSAYEQLCTKLYDRSLSDLWEYQGIQFTYNDRLGDAAAAFEKDTSAARKWLMGNPFNGRINDCHDCDHQAPMKIAYTKLSLVKKMKEMQDKVRKGEDVYNNALLLGNAYYNITHFGNARAFYESKVIGASGSHPFSYIDTAFGNYILGMQLATKYYTAALNAATNNEQKAKCQYMLAKCERNEWYNAEVYSGKEKSEASKIDFKAWDGFKALKEYSGTKYYQEVINECGYFRTYISK